MGMKVNAMLRYVRADQKLFKVLIVGTRWPHTQHSRNLSPTAKPLLYIRGLRIRHGLLTMKLASSRVNLMRLVRF